MRTTIDIPDSLFRQLKSASALRGETLRAFLLRAAEAELNQTKKPAKGRIKLPLVQSKEPSYDLSSDRIAEILEEEDIESSARY